VKTLLFLEREHGEVAVVVEGDVTFGGYRIIVENFSCEEDLTSDEADRALQALIDAAAAEDSPETVRADRMADEAKDEVQS
jgi:hypothetical protein